VAGASDTAIARELNAEKIPAAMGGPWHAVSVGRIRRNRTYLGEVPHNGQQHTGQHEALIDKRTFKAAQFTVRKPRRGRPTQGRYLLTALEAPQLVRRGAGPQDGRPVLLYGDVVNGQRTYRLAKRCDMPGYAIDVSEPAGQAFPSRIDAAALERAVVEPLLRAADNGVAGLLLELEGRSADLQEGVRRELLALGQRSERCRREVARRERLIDKALEAGLAEEIQRYKGELATWRGELASLAGQRTDLERRLKSKAKTNIRATLTTKVNIIAELIRLDEREMLREFLGALIERISLRADGDRLHADVYLAPLAPEFRGEIQRRREALLCYTISLPRNRRDQIHTCTPPPRRRT
jgi:hypothetical protein